MDTIENRIKSALININRINRPFSLVNRTRFGHKNKIKASFSSFDFFFHTVRIRTRYTVLSPSFIYASSSLRRASRRGTASIPVSCNLYALFFFVLPFVKWTIFCTKVQKKLERLARFSEVKSVTWSESNEARFRKLFFFFLVRPLGHLGAK